jgi:KipI family sensor histidine kinase inhibitor
MRCGGMNMRILSLGDGAFTVEFAAGFDAAARRSVTRLDAAVAAACGAGRLRGVTGTTPTFRSLTVHYDPLLGSRATLEPQVAGLIGERSDAAPAAGIRWRLPVAYGGEGGPDLEPLAAAAGLSAAGVVELHAGTEVEVHMLGFLPGFAFMGDIAAPLRLPRRTEPRTRVPAGAVAIADRLTAIYPWESPGGWHLIGTCPVPLFAPDRDPPALLAPGDRVGFAPTDAAEVARLAAAARAGALDPMRFRVPA